MDQRCMNCSYRDECQALNSMSIKEIIDAFKYMLKVPERRIKHSESGWCSYTTKIAQGTDIFKIGFFMGTLPSYVKESGSLVDIPYDSKQTPYSYIFTHEYKQIGGTDTIVYIHKVSKRTGNHTFTLEWRIG